MAGQSIGRVSILNQGFASSSPNLRAWRDKKTGQVKNHLHTTESFASFVVAESATVADVFGTTLAIAPETHIPDQVKVLILLKILD